MGMVGGVMRHHSYRNSVFKRIVCLFRVYFQYISNRDLFENTETITMVMTWSIVWFMANADESESRMNHNLST